MNCHHHAGQNCNCDKLPEKESYCELCNYEDKATICIWCHKKALQEQAKRILELREECMDDDYGFDWYRFETIIKRKFSGGKK